MGDFVSGEVAQQRWVALLDVVDDAYGQLRELCCDEVGQQFRVEVAERLEAQQRTNRGLMYRVFGLIADPPDAAGMAPVWADRIGARLRIPRKEVTRRMRTAARICPRRPLCGAPLDPALPEVAAAVRHGLLGEDHLRAITAAMDRLPSAVSPVEAGEVEAALVAEATKNDAEIVTAIGRRIDEIFNPDGDFDEHDRARRRALTVGPQGPDGMSRLSGWIDPQLRCSVEAVAAAVRPGRHRPDGTLAETRDDRTPAQRCHDGIKLALNAAIAAGGLGPHRGHPVTVIVRTTLAELNQAAHAVTDPTQWMPGPARTGGHTVLPMRDLIRMATDAIHYLAVFDEHCERPLYLGRQKRIATTDQRMICYARDGGCTRPDCLAPGYHSAVHHSPDWAAGGATDADKLFFACDPHHDQATNGHYTTEVTATGRLAWTDHTGPPQINHAHHPEELLRGNPDPPQKDEGC